MIDMLIDKFKGYNGNTNIKRKGIQVQFTEDMMREYVKCAEDPIYFAEKYVQIVHVDHGLVPISLYDYQNEILQKITNNRRAVAVTSRQAGKALSIDTPIPMADGSWKTMGAINVGDIIIGADGKPTRVTFKSEIHNKPTYRIEIESAREPVYACEDHLWQVFDRLDRQNKVVDTKTIAKQFQRKNKRGYYEYRYAILNSAPVEYSKKDLPLDPYTLGCWLGDGFSASSGFVCDPSDKQHYEQNDIQFTAELSYSRNCDNNFTSSIVGASSKLRSIGVLNNKHIPEIYKTSSIEQRSWLLTGLMDTDGFVEKHGTLHIQLSNKNLTLIDDIHDLICSLGFKVTRSFMAGTNSTRLSFSTSYEHIVPVLIDRKLKRIKKTLPKDRYVFSRSIRKVETVPTQQTQCVTVDNKDSLFLFGRDYIPTHNTTTAVVVILHYILFNEDKTVALLSNKGDSAREILNRIKIAYEALPKWLQQGVQEWNKGSVEFENGCKIIAAATSSSAIRGRSISFLYIDECVTGDTMITVRNKKTQEISQMSIKAVYDFYN